VNLHVGRNQILALALISFCVAVDFAARRSAVTTISVYLQCTSTSVSDCYVEPNGARDPTRVEI